MRSIATFNDGTFQFYAVHFGQSMSATHGSVMLSQAAFVNDALRYISSEHGNPVNQILLDYITNIQVGTHKVIILAHSAGGMVARTAMILSNYPRCYVSGIIMFGTPNSRCLYSKQVHLYTSLFDCYQTFLCTRCFLSDALCCGKWCLEKIFLHDVGRLSRCLRH